MRVHDPQEIYITYLGNIPRLCAVEEAEYSKFLSNAEHRLLVRS